LRKADPPFVDVFPVEKKNGLRPHCFTGLFIFSAGLIHLNDDVKGHFSNCFATISGVFFLLWFDCPWDQTT